MIQNITIVGAGLVGRTAARLSARAGFSTTLEDISGQMIDPAMAELRASLTDSEFAKITPCTRIEDSVRNAELVIEAVPEDMETKLEIFTVLDKSAPPNALLASTTMALSMTELASITLRSGRTMGMHFYDRLIELVRGIDTTSDTLDAGRFVAGRMGLPVITIAESPGFVVSRLRVVHCNEAFALVHEGVASPADVDTAAKLAGGDPVGPFEWADAFGLDNLIQELERLEKVYGDRFRPNPLLAQYVKAGRTGKRVGRGVYKYA